MFLGIVGSRRRNSDADKNLIREKIKTFIDKGTVVLVSGGCKKGADRFADELAVELGLEIITFLPDLNNCKQKYQFTKEYFKRNRQIAEKSDVLIACVAPDRKGGTENTISEFRKNRVFKNGNSELILL